VFDLIGKLRELELTGDRNAARKLSDFERYRQNKDIGSALDFERKKLEFAKDEFELLSPMQYDDLARLVDDRNRCAHPSMISADEAYDPSAELARAHLRNAVEYLLQHQPVQGQAALDRLTREVESPYFPITSDDAIRHFQQGPLLRPRERLVRNFVVCIVKTLVVISPNTDASLRWAAALNAVMTLHREMAEAALAEKLSDIVRHTSDNDLRSVITLLALVRDSWRFLDDDVGLRVVTFVRVMPTDQLVPGLLRAFDVPDLQPAAAQRLALADSRELILLVSGTPRREFVDRALSLYAESSTFATANTLGLQLILPLAPHFQVDDVIRICEIAAENGQVTASRELRKVIEGAALAAGVTQDKLAELISTYKLDKENNGVGLLKAEIDFDLLIESEQQLT